MTFVAGRGLYDGNNHFKHNNINKYRRMTRGQDGIELMSVIDLMLVKRGMLKHMQDVKTVRRIARNLSDQSVELYKVKLVGV